MAFKGRINIREIDKKSVQLDGTQQEEWVKDILRRSAPSEELTGLSAEHWMEQSTFSTDLRLETAGSDYTVVGQLKACVPAPCSRCGDNFKVDRASDFRLILHRIHKGEEELADEDSGDPDYIFLKQDEIDLVEIVAEQLMVQEPVAECPARREDGSCSLCAKNPQFAGQTNENKADSPFAKLGSLKDKA